MIDTGSTDTIVSASIYHKIEKESRPELQPFTDRIQQVDGSPLEVLGTAWVDIIIGKTTQSIKAIFANIKCEGILGMDFLLQTQGVLNFQRCSLQIHGEEIPCSTQRGEAFVARVKVACSTTIPPGHEAIVPGYIADKNDNMMGTAVVEPLENGGEVASKGVIIGRTLVDAEKEIIPVRVFNSGDSPCDVQAGLTVGMITSAAVEPEKENCHDFDVLPPHLEDLYNRSTENIEPRHHQQIKMCLIEYGDVFSKNSRDIGRTDIVQHHIKTGDAKPVKQKARRHPLCNQQEIDRQVQDLLDRDVIEPSESPWAANIVLVKKKDGTKRLCVDYRDLNEVTIKDAYPIPRIDETLDALGSAKWFSTLDLSSGYWQVALDEDDKDKTSFIVRNGLYQWKVMPFGLTNAPATFERLMEKVMKGLQWEILLVYLDDIIVYGRTVEEEIQRLRMTFSRLRDAHLKLKPSKCHLFCTTVTYLGHVVSADGVSTDPAKVQAINDWPRPKCKKEVRSFIGLASYYRKFVRGFAEIASPLHMLTAKSAKFQWSEDCENSFQELKRRLQCTPILTFPTPEDEFVLDTDASSEAVGAVLSQVQDGQERVIAYFSRKLHKAEKNYCVTRQELLALVTALKQFKQYLYGRRVKVRTDHASLRWLVHFRNPEGQLARWLEQIAEYDLNIEHRPGRNHSNADGLSRMRCKQCGRMDEEEDSTEALNTMPQSPSLEEMGRNVRGIASQPSTRKADLREAQLADDTIRWIINAKEKDDPRPGWGEVAQKSAAVKTYWAQWSQLEVNDGVLYRRWESDDGESVTRKIVMPEKLRKDAIRDVHDGPLGAHLGQRKTLAKLKGRFYWCGMTADVRSFIRMCNLCARRKTPGRKRRAPLQQSRVGAPMERIALDLMGPLPKTDAGNQWILVVGDYHTKWVEAYALPDARAETVAKKLVEEFVCRFGIPLEIHSDQGSNFESHLFAEMCTLLGVRKTRTTPYNPKSDGMIERFNRTLLSMIAIMVEEDKTQRTWDEHLQYATSAYRSTPHETTGETPNMMMLGRESRLPVDMTNVTPEEETEETRDYAATLRVRLQQAYERAEICTGKSAMRQKKNYDRKTNHPGLKEGDFVWLFDPSKKKGVSPKLQLRWRGPHLIVTQLSDVVFRIQASPRAKTVVVHADRLKPYNGEKLTSWTWERPPPKSDSQSDDSTTPPVNVADNDEIRDISSPPTQALDDPISQVNDNEENTPSQASFSHGQSENDNVRRYPKRVRRRPRYFDEYTNDQ